jgi:hypothetical protein
MDIKTKVLDKIEKGDVHKRPKAYFIAQVLLITLLCVMGAALSIFILSFMIFSFYQSGEQFLLGFGTQGVITFFALFPWMLLILDILLFVFIEWLLRYFKFGYRIPVVWGLLGILGIALFGGIIVSLTSLHSTLLQKADQDGLPIIGELYESIHASHSGQGVFRGTIKSIQGNQFVIFHNDRDRDVDDGILSVIVPSGFDLASLAVGEKVYVAGIASSGTIQAYGIGELSSGM